MDPLSILPFVSPDNNPAKEIVLSMDGTQFKGYIHGIISHGQTQAKVKTFVINFFGAEGTHSLPATYRIKSLEINSLNRVDSIVLISTLIKPTLPGAAVALVNPTSRQLLPIPPSMHTFMEARPAPAPDVLPEIVETPNANQLLWYVEKQVTITHDDIEYSGVIKGVQNGEGKNFSINFFGALRESSGPYSNLVLNVSHWMSVNRISLASAQGNR